MTIQTIVTIEKLSEEPYASIVSYPQADKAELNSRIKELSRLGITALDSAGEKQVCNVQVIGKGCVGIVVAAYMNGQRVALKIRRVDANRTSMQHEAELLKKANSVNVGPRLLDASKNFLCMQYINGELLPKWLKNKRKKRIRKVLKKILVQCWHLDNTNLDHGELSHAPKHVMIDRHDEPFIVDFESASSNRRPSNVTSICQFLFMGSQTAKEVSEKLGLKDREIIADALRRYKNERTFENVCRVLEVCRL